MMKRLSPSQTKRVPKARPRWHAPAAAVVGVFVLVAIVTGWQVLSGLPQATGRGASNTVPASLRANYVALERDVKAFETYQTQNDVQVVSAADLNDQLSQIELAAAGGRYIQAAASMRDLRQKLATWRKDVAVAKATPPATPTPSQAPLVLQQSQGRFIPILIYHYTPPDFDAQLTYLENHDYTVIDLAQVATAMRTGGSLPAKPVVITYDDGFANQMVAFEDLKRHNMKATFYIINGGSASNWCIGSGRKYGLPSQPVGGCGDAYLTWDQVRELDQSGLITIAGHTLDHPHLAQLPRDEARRQIVESKAGIEAEIGHPIYDFAYPYGNYDDSVISMVRAAGYRTAVTTITSDYQPQGSIYTLRRNHNVYNLP